ncbi:MAG: TIGR02300 family protein [Alphaproteobacteria bacterium]
MSASADPRGLKRICNGCGARFYDLNKRPIICPSCGAEFTGEIEVKNRRGRAAAAEGQVEEKTAKEAVEEEGEIEAVDAVSLDDVEEKDGDEEDEVAGDLDLDSLEGGDDLDEDGDDLDGLEGDVDLTTDSDKD